jgi:phage shock protein PspC (stress-responsive transcriptional regulator)
MEEQDMTAQQAAAGNGFERGHKRHSHRGCRFKNHNHEGKECHGVIGRTTRGISSAFGIPRKGVLAAFILILIFSFPVGVLLFGLAWAYVHHPDWFDGLRGKIRGSSRRAQAQARTAKADDVNDSPTVGVDYEESWMEELREQFDDLERRTGSMEGFVASGEYRVASELEKMKKDDASEAAKKDGDDVSKPEEPKA